MAYLKDISLSDLKALVASATPGDRQYDPDRGPRTRRIYKRRKDRKALDESRPDIRQAYGKTVLYVTRGDAEGNMILSDGNGSELCVRHDTNIEAILIFLQTVVTEWK